MPNFFSSRCVRRDHVQIMPTCLVGHDVSIGPFTTLAQSATISSYVSIGEGCFIGTGVVIVNGTKDKPLQIGDGAFVGIGFVVTKLVDAGVRVFGNPAKPIRTLRKKR